MGEIRRQTATGLKWTAIERFSIQGAQFLLGIIVARLLTPEDYGLVGILSIFMTISQTLIDSGIGNALIRKLDRTEKDYSTAFYFNLIISIGCATALFFSSHLIADFFHQPKLSAIARLSSVNLIIGSLAMVQISKFTIELNFKIQAKINLSAAIISGLVSLALAYCGWGVWALVWQGIIANIIRAVGFWISCNWRPSAGFSKDSFRDLFGFGSKILVTNIINSIYQQLTTLAIGKFYTPAALGKYTRGTSMASLPSNMITDMLGRVTFPIFSKIQNDDESLIYIYRKYISVTMMPIIFCLILLAVLAKPIILMLLTEKWVHSIVFLQIFVFSIMFDPICQMNLNLLQVKGRSDLVLKLEVIKKSIALGILCLSIPFGVVAICISKVIYTQVAVAFNTYYTGKLFGLGYWRQLKDFSPYILYSLISCAPAAIIEFICPINLITIISGSLISSILYIQILRIRGDMTYSDYIQPALLTLKNRFFKIR